MTSQIENGALHGFELRPSFTQLGDEMVMGSAEWLDGDGARHERYYVLTIRDGRIADMQACGSRRQAKRFAGRIASRAAPLT